MAAWMLATASASSGTVRSMPSTSATNSCPIGMNRMTASFSFPSSLAEEGWRGLLQQSLSSGTGPLPTLPRPRGRVYSMRQRIGAQLEVHDQRARQRLRGLAGGARGRGVDAFDMHRGAVAGGHPQTTALPASIGVVDAAVEALGKEAHRIRHAQLDHPAADQCMERIRLVASGDRDVGAEPQDVVLVDPGVIRIFLRTRIALKARSGDRIERKALGTFLPKLRAGPVERALALAAVEACDVS